MTQERTEEAGLSGFLDVTIGGSPVRLRALTIAESDTWLDLYADAMATADVMQGDAPGDMMRSLVKSSGAAALRLVKAYDIDGTLGDIETVATRREVAAALEMMVTVEDPLVEDAGRLMRAAFGLPTQTAAERLEEEVVAPMLRLVKSLSTPSALGDSTTPETSATDGPVNNSSSTGPTRRTATTATRKSAAS